MTRITLGKDSTFFFFLVVLSWSRRRRLWARDESRETIRRRHHDAADTCHHHHSVKNCQPKTKKCPPGLYLNVANVARDPPPGAGGSVAMMSNEEALLRAEHGATILALDVPPGSSFGIDCVSFTCGEKFQGVKMIPPGLHLVSVGAGGNDHARVSEFVRLGGGDVAVFRWDPATETFAPGSGMDDDEADRFRAGARNHDFDRTTGPYPLEAHRKWLAMVDFVTDDALRACGAEVGARLAPGDPDDAVDAEGRRIERTRGSTARGSDSDVRVDPSPTPASDPDAPRPPRFGDAASRAPKGASPEEVTRLGHDPAARLRRALATANGDWRRLLGETQVAFSLFLALGSAPAFEHWKAMTAMLCDASAEARAGDPFLSLYDGFIRAFASQLDLAEGVDGASDVVREGRFLGDALDALLRGAGEALRGARGQTAARARRSLQVLEAVATRRFGIETPRTRAKRSFFGGRETGEFLAAGDAGGSSNSAPRRRPRWCRS